MNKIFCQNCKRELAENETPCLSCGETKRIFTVTAEDTITPNTSLGFKQKRPGYKRPILEGVSRIKESRDPKLAGQKVHEEYSTDRIKNVWNQVVKDLETGEIIEQEINIKLEDKNQKKEIK